MVQGRGIVGQVLNLSSTFETVPVVCGEGPKNGRVWVILVCITLDG